jgi:hypothetical protein
MSRRRSISRAEYLEERFRGETLHVDDAARRRRRRAPACGSAFSTASASAVAPVRGSVGHAGSTLTRRLLDIGRIREGAGQKAASAVSGSVGAVRSGRPFAADRSARPAGLSRGVEAPGEVLARVTHAHVAAVEAEQALA